MTTAPVSINVKDIVATMLMLSAALNEVFLPAIESIIGRMAVRGTQVDAITIAKPSADDKMPAMRYRRENDCICRSEVDVSTSFAPVLILPTPVCQLCQPAKSTQLKDWMSTPS
jgi:hypothetical protein